MSLCKAVRTINRDHICMYPDALFVCACRGKLLPSMLEARIDAPLSCTHGLNSDPNAMATRNPLAVGGTRDAPANGNATTVV